MRLMADRPTFTLDESAYRTGDGRAMAYVEVADLGNNLEALIERAQAGEEIVIVRRGKEVARLVPPAPQAVNVPDLAQFRASIKLEGEPLSETVIRQRREARY